MRVSRTLSEKVHSLKRRRVEIKSRCKFFQRHLAPKKNREKIVLREESFKGMNLMSAVLHTQVWGEVTRGNLAPRRVVRKDKLLYWRSVYSIGWKTCFTLLLKPGQRWRPLPNNQRKENSRLIPELRCTCWAKKRFELRRTGNSKEIQNHHRAESPKHHNGGNGKWWCANKRRSTSVCSRIMASSWLCKYSKIRLRFYRLVSFAKNTDIHMSWPAVSNHGWPKRWRTLHAKRITSYLLPFQETLQYWYKFVFNIVIAGLVIYKSRNRAKWRTSTRKVGPRKKKRWQSRCTRTFARSSWMVGGVHR